MSALVVVLSFAASTAGAQLPEVDGGTPMVDAGAPVEPAADEVDEVLKELERESRAGGVLPAPLLDLAEEPRAPSWTDLVTPVFALRMRPFLQLGHPTSTRVASVSLQLRGWLGAEVRPVEGVTTRLVFSAHQWLPRVTEFGPEVILDAWLKWQYAALGGALTLRAGRQEVAASEIVFGRNDFLLVPPRYDGLHARLDVWKVFFAAFLGSDALRALPAAGAYLDVTGVGLLQAGLQWDEHRIIEAHLVARAPSLPLQGDAGPTALGRMRVTGGGRAEWNLFGVHGLAALDVQQERFAPPSVWAPSLAGILSAGYAPPYDWAFGLRAEGGVRGAMGQPMTYLPLVARVGWQGVAAAEFVAQSSAQQGRFGEMDLGTFRNMYDVFARVGIARDRLRHLAITVHRLALFNARGDWVDATGRTLLKAGEGGPDPRVGYEVDLSAEAELTRFLSVGGAVGLLSAGDAARRAGFAAFAQTAYVTVEFRL